MPGPHTPDFGPKIDPHASAGGYQRMKCTFRSNGQFAGYLASSKNAYVWLTQDPNHAAKVKFIQDSKGRWWLEKETSPNDRFLGVGDSDYADWGLWQAQPNGYIEPIVYNADHTISLATDTSKSLYGPYGDQWVCWGKDPNILVCNLE